jgi:hypothetical protein
LLPAAGLIASIWKRPLTSVRAVIWPLVTFALGIGACVSALTTVPTTRAGSHSGCRLYSTVVVSSFLKTACFVCGQ